MIIGIASGQVAISHLCLSPDLHKLDNTRKIRVSQCCVAQTVKVPKFSLPNFSFPLQPDISDI